MGGFRKEESVSRGGFWVVRGRFLGGEEGERDRGRKRGLY